MEISEQGIALIKRFEGFSPTPYLCPAGLRTIGYGHVVAPSDHIPPGGIDEDAAEALLKQDVAWAEQVVGRLVTVALSQCQFDALVSFVYNVGSGAFAGSTLLSLINQSDIDGAAGQFLRWTYASGQQIPGLVERRKAESALFLGGGGAGLTRS